jgi:aspartate ammonia-lyase
MNKHIQGEQRVERDYVGEVAIPGDKLYGVNTVRGVDNLTVSPLSVAHYPEFRDAFAHVKWAAALANRDNDVVTKEQCDAIVNACQEVIEGKFDASLVVDLMEGSGGTSTNMNFNEVIANRAQQLLGHPAGSYEVVHPNDRRR